LIVETERYEVKISGEQPIVHLDGALLPLRPQGGGCCGPADRLVLAGRNGR
jgi:hypothetical protein